MNSADLGRRVGVPSTALFTDQYELTMVQAALKAGTADRHAVFEAFTRRLPEGRRYGVVAGTGRVLDAVENFHFDDEMIGFLRQQEIVDEPTLEWLAGYRFSGDIWGYPEGEVYFPGSPVLRVEGSFAECVLLETVILSILNHDSAIAAAASRMSAAAGGRRLIEMGARRTHELSAVASARAAFVGGFDATSDLAAGFRWAIPTVGTSAHAFTLLHDTERDAFRAQVDSLGRGTTLLVDTYDVAEAVRAAVEIAGPELGAVRIDSGDLLLVAHRVRQQLDELGATGTKIVVTSDLDEYAIASLAAAPVDAYGVGTQLVTGSGHPTCSMVYKLVARAASGEPDAPLVPVAKKSLGAKSSKGGRKWAVRRTDAHGVAEAEVIGTGDAPGESAGRPLLVELVRAGEVVAREPLEAARQRHVAARAGLPMSAIQLSRGEPVIPTEYA
ncbi:MULTISPECIES: nicotinate phosphoribosyltransferase [Streptomyces]|uniref:Nicotinate phosphoribosyltransferase n=1 Tax=Streptomyces griseus subsp. griseus (strain JCM 4626 / CBS 651.72 / NBRC 13350 / KCC S-0626 / ISP 5235) TaxID=455632 RepID=B1VVU0_STRGG|nr:nicotinate phosphoribosyltransferase [Streptomyces griseus]MBW3707107.1 nicotinate phosphoribosyltransferase [Streptomyces griseus]NEB57302.1 nicotinate phosphoribosyltransferase [Streptomyces griseus]SEE66257.1 nicotinate phosphoribosyltransferase [Streptomyces griseus]SQA22937.1 nicotinate phosphoribosyltransferase [Streptomyces griseus]BAG21451.1 putative nicotinate phosphoribosyltransferase [Streptomyces griseus subsp. griseus NBRC 13350]